LGGFCQSEDNANFAKNTTVFFFLIDKKKATTPCPLVDIIDQRIEQVQIIMIHGVTLYVWNAEVQEGLLAQWVL
jgi:hypothetical protein